MQPQGESAVLRLHPRRVRIQTALAKPALLRLGLQVRPERCISAGRADDTTAVALSMEYMHTHDNFELVCRPRQHNLAGRGGRGRGDQFQILYVLRRKEPWPNVLYLLRWLGGGTYS